MASQLSGGKNLKVPVSSTLKPLSPQAQLSSTLSNLTLFLTNLRLLDFDLRHDWPDITSATFSTKDAQQNQKKRIQCVEWALYQLFSCWDPAETRNKLQPFFPPLEPLQSINLRAALFRCLDQAKKRGALGRDTVLRKTMLDECKGERLEEVLAVFSTAVVKKVVQEEPNHYGRPIAVQLATENFSYTGERTVLTVLNLAHRGVMSKELRQKHETKARLEDFEELLDLKERQIVRRQEQLNESVSARVGRDCITAEELERLSAKLQKNWSGNNEWLQTILHGDGRFEKDGIFVQSFNEVWKHVTTSSVTEVDNGKKRGLLDQLDTRVKQQNHRLAKWQHFRKSFSNGEGLGKTPSKISLALQRSKRGIDLKFGGHETLQINQKHPGTTEIPTLNLSEEYSQLVAKMERDLGQIGRTGKKHQSLRKSNSSPHKPDTPQSADELDAIEVPRQASVSPPIMEKDNELDENDEWNSTDSEQELRPIVKSTPLILSSLAYQSRRSKGSGANTPATKEYSESQNSSEEDRKEFDDVEPQPKGEHDSTITSAQNPLEPSLVPKRSLTSDSEAMADKILSSIATASPSPVKPKVRHTFSLAERTRISMVRASRSDFDDLPDLSPIKQNASPSAPTPVVRISEEVDPHADLIARTRQSMSGFAAAQKKAEISRRRSVKAAAKKARESSFFPPPFSMTTQEAADKEPEGWEKVDRAGLIEGNADADYESVFKSRPKIALSPAVSPLVSPTKWDREEEELEDFEEESSPMRRLGTSR